MVLAALGVVKVATAEQIRQLMCPGTASGQTVRNGCLDLGRDGLVESLGSASRTNAAGNLVSEKLWNLTGPGLEAAAAVLDRPAREMDAEGAELTRVEAEDDPGAQEAAMRHAAVVAAVRRDRGFAVQQLRTSELSVPVEELRGLPRIAPAQPKITVATGSSAGPSRPVCGRLEPPVAWSTARPREAPCAGASRTARAHTERGSEEVPRRLTA
ncbi:hypothetical protein ACH4LK_36320 [Streptomyces lydicus]|uniref:hypothetical protein n=1 Tax=Streptomyces lydicus TaxID=47763 RepID=UPI0037B66796